MSKSAPITHIDSEAINTKTTEKAAACANKSSVMHSSIRTVNKLHRTETKNIVALIAVMETKNR